MSKKNSINNLLLNNSLIFNGKIVQERKRVDFFKLSWEHKKNIKKLIIQQITSNEILNQLLIDHKICLNSIEFIKLGESNVEENKKNICLNFNEKTKSEIEK